jgi:thymidine phosphorylase
VNIGSEVKAGESLGLVYCKDQGKAREAAERIRAAYRIGAEKPAQLSLVKEVINQ